MNWFSMSLYHALAMLWQTFWALVLGFAFSAALQVFVSKEQMMRAFGRAGFREVALATGLGAASSSCSYAAAAAGRSAFQKGAPLVPVLAFMFASTNLVVELGAVLWLLMGWRFVLAEIIGSFVLIGVMWLLVKMIFPKDLEGEARSQATRAASEDDCGHGEHQHEHGSDEIGRGKWSRFADAFVMDCGMLWKEILGGFVIAGFLMTLVPANWWQSFFLRDVAAPLRLVENAAVGPLIAIASFVCSVGNIPLASLLWSNGISFGGVISFIYADLIVIPLILTYAKYYGARGSVHHSRALSFHGDLRHRRRFDLRGGWTDSGRPATAKSGGSGHDSAQLHHVARRHRAGRFRVAFVFALPKANWTARDSRPSHALGDEVFRPD